MKGTYAAFAVGFARQQVKIPMLAGLDNLRPLSSLLQKDTKLFSTFKAPEPPQSKGQLVYDDIDVTNRNQDSLIRNSDPDAVFVVSGGSRSKLPALTCCGDPCALSAAVGCCSECRRVALSRLFCRRLAWR